MKREGTEVQTNTINTDISIKDSLKTRLILLITVLIIITAFSLSYLYSDASNRIIFQQHNKLKLLQEQLQSVAMFSDTT